jgi:hypothetical protein
MNLAQLRELLAKLTADAAAKRGELKDGIAKDVATRIESEHAEILRKLEKCKTDIAAAERAEADAARTAPSPAAPAAAPVVDAGAVLLAAQQAIATERQRAAGIEQLGQRFGQAEFATQHVKAGTTVEQFRSLLIDKLAEQSDGHRTLSQAANGRVEVICDEGETRRRAMTDAIVARLARAGAKPGERVEIPEHARAYGELGFVEMAAESCNWRGQLRTARQVSDMLTRAFHTQSDFPGIFVDAINRRLLARYQVAMPTYRRFAALYTTTDFRPTNVVRAGDFPALQPISEGGEIKAGTFSESKEQFRVYPYGVKFNISRTMIINDNLRALDQVIGSAGERVMDWENTKVFAVLLSASGAGPTLLTDNVALFHASHSNLAGAGTVIDVTNVGAGRAAMMKQKTLDGMQANFQPSVLLCGPDKLTQAEQLLTSITPAQTSNAVPESLRRLVPVGDGNIAGNPWYLFADPAVAPCFVYGYLEGFDGPRLSSDEPFDVQGLRVKLEHDFGAAAIDFRGGYRNPGA